MVFKQAVFLGPALLAAVPNPALATDPVRLPQVVVSATRSEQSEVTTPASITIIDQTEIQASGARHLTEVLRSRGGVQVRDLFGDGSRPTVGVRGFDASANANTLVLVDGRRLNNTDIGNPDLSSISLKDVERIEIIQGSAGTLYGDQAVGGVINIITRRPGDFSASIQAGLGSWERRDLRARVSDALDSGIAYRLSAEFREAENYRDNNALDYANLAGRLDLEHARGTVFLEVQQSDEDLQTPGSLFGPEVTANRRQSALPEVAQDTETSVLRLGLSQALSDNWSLEAEIANREADTRGALGFRGAAPSPFDQGRHLKSFTPRLLGSYDLAHGEAIITAGYDLERSDYKITSVLGVQANEQDSRGLYVQGVLPVSPVLNLTLGLRRAWVENDLTAASLPAGSERDDNQTVAEIGLSYRPRLAWRWFARRDENLRFAKVDEQAGASPGVSLDTQTGVSWELGGEYRANGRRAKILAYRLDLDDEIAFDPTAPSLFGPFFPGANVNLEATRREGLILEGGMALSANLRLSASYSYTDARFRSGVFDGKRVSFVAPHTLGMALDADLSAHWRMRVGLDGVSSRYLAGDNANLFPKSPGYTVLSLNSSYESGPWRVSARVNNLLDKQYSDFATTGFNPATFATEPAFFPAPEREFQLAVSYQMD